ncbi:MAG: WG repeat-containing protein [Bacteroidales bacterium]|nr:WG repeat-containing protein [Bacteroidales bacterium]
MGHKILSSGKVLVEPKYQNLDYPYEGLIKARLNDKTGFIDFNGKVIVPFKYHDANYFAEGLAAVSQETKSGWKIGFVDKTGKLVIEMKYYSMYLDRTRFYNGVAVVAKEKIMGMV